MRTATGSRFWLMAMLLVINLILLGINVTYLVLRTADFFSSDPGVAQASKDAAHLGMEVGYVKSPLVLFVDKGFPRKDAFQLFDSRQQLLMSGQATDPDAADEATRKAVIALGEDFAIQCYYSPGKRIRVHEVWLSTAEGSYFDMNADGFYDFRALYPAKGGREEHPRSQVWYDGQWRDVADDDGRGKWIRTLQDGGMVEFDKERGRWLPVADGSAKNRPEPPTDPNDQARSRE